MGTDDLEALEYSPVAHLDQLFQSPAALLELDGLLAHTRAYKTELDGYLEQQQQQYNAGAADAGAAIAAIEHDLTQIVAELENTKTLARSTERTINAMTSNIKKLDNCKRNMTLSMTILKRLQMLVTSYDNVEHIIYNSNTKNYYEIYQLLSAVIELMDHFQSYKSIDDINNLSRKIAELKARTVDEIFSDFGKELSGEYSTMELTNACRILDLLGSSYRDKLANWFIASQLKEIQSIFRSSEEAGSLENLSRRFIFFKRVFKTVETKYAAKFPGEWDILYQLADRFCDVTRTDLKEVLAKDAPSIGVNLLLAALSETLEFENFLNMKFKVLNAAAHGATVRNFDSTVSAVFEPYLDIWLDYQDKAIGDKFLEFMNPAKLLEQETSDGSSSLNVLNSSADLFRVYRSLLSQLSKLTNRAPLLKLSNVFVKYLDKYLEMVLRPIVPSFDDIKGNSESENEDVLAYTCLVLNTTDYCSLTISQLQERLAACMDAALVPQMEKNFDRVKDTFTALMNRCLNLVCFKINDDLSLQWRTMVNLNWKNLDSVEDTSTYIYDINRSVNANAAVVFDKVNRAIYQKTFMNKLVELICYSFFINVVKLKPITEVMAEQLLLDLRALKDNLLALPDQAKGHDEPLGSKYFTNFVNLATGNIESVLRVILIETKPIENFATNYFYIIGDKDFNNFVKVLKLKGALPLTGIHHGANFNRGDVSRFNKVFSEQLNRYEDSFIDADDSRDPAARTNRPLVDDFKFLAGHNIDAIDYNTDHNPPWLWAAETAPDTSAAAGTAASRVASPQLKGVGGISISSPFNNTNNMNKLINNRKDQVEKNFSKTMDNFKINDNFKNLNIGKFFKRNESGTNGS